MHLIPALAGIFLLNDLREKTAITACCKKADGLPATYWQVL